MSKRWQYKVVELKGSFLGLQAPAIEEKLAQLGAQGWELVSAVPHGMAVRLYLKKEQ
ncbi:DUF4177 domain-containing protein [Luteimonas kalidii]|uniref:DUF4177 domain-containing protein n=1 Tax=Luteimonas kalidii TaxID=3042025 RepID=A0ABT6JW26_9GAMM|nr:DUF4177 domain-containing protein [Luteimonas kalidii]MDH5834892.1 DUF4177 domain-containing protein [Luteimonas kalidii]